MILHEDLYLDFITQRGVGDNDVVASSQASYLSYLNGVSKLIGKDISPQLLGSDDDVLEVLDSIEGEKAANTIRNYRSAMRQYVAMVQEHNL